MLETTNTLTNGDRISHNRTKGFVVSARSVWVGGWGWGEGALHW